jgi:hypothetical protein
VRKLKLLLPLIISTLSPGVLAEMTLKQCGFIDSDFLPATNNQDEAPIDVKADSAKLVEGDISLFNGDVLVNRGGQELRYQDKQLQKEMFRFVIVK